MVGTRNAMGLVFCHVLRLQNKRVEETRTRSLLLQGYDCTIGLARWIDRPFDEDCDIVQVGR